MLSNNQILSHLLKLSLLAMPRVRLMPNRLRTDAKVAASAETSTYTKMPVDVKTPKDTKSFDMEALDTDPNISEIQVYGFCADSICCKSSN